MARDLGFPEHEPPEEEARAQVKKAHDTGAKVALFILIGIFILPLLIIASLADEADKRAAEESLVEYQSISLDTTDTVFLLTEDLPLDTSKYEEVGTFYRRKTDEKK